MTGAGPLRGVIAALALIAGALVTLLPEYGAGILQLAIMSVAVTAGLGALGIVPEWKGLQRWSPFERQALRRASTAPPVGVTRIRQALGGQRAVLEGCPPMPLEVLRILQPLIRDAAERAGGETMLSPVTRAVLESDSRTPRPWAQTRRGKTRSVTDVVEHVLHDIERLNNPQSPS